MFVFQDFVSRAPLQTAIPFTDELFPFTFYRRFGFLNSRAPLQISKVERRARQSTFLFSIEFHSLVTMKPSVGFGTFSVLLATATAAAVEASSLHDAAVLKGHSVHAHVAHPGKHYYSSHVLYPGVASVKLEQSASQDSPSNYPEPSPGAGTIKPVNAGKCYPVGATGTTQYILWLPGESDYCRV